jgi:DNA-3-methyladenine glycosylase
MKKNHPQKVSLDFYRGEDVLQIAQDLIGMYLCTNIDGQLCKGMIVETEAYKGMNDKACHANNNKRTPRTEIFYQEGGVAYVYLCYGIHHLFNIITSKSEKADAILIRAIEPIEGMDEMLRRRNLQKVEKRLCSGPGVLSAAMGINSKHYGVDLLGDEIWLEIGNSPYLKSSIIATPRIGVDYAGADALLPYRFLLKGNTWISGPKL